MRYHQSKQDKHSHRVTALKKVEDAYNYDGITFPTDYEGIKKFEEANEVSILVYAIGEDGGVVKEKDGNPVYFSKDHVYLLRVENEETSHYIYIKHLGGAGQQRQPRLLLQPPVLPILQHEGYAREVGQAHKQLLQDSQGREPAYDAQGRLKDELHAPQEQARKTLRRLRGFGEHLGAPS